MARTPRQLLVDKIRRDLTELDLSDSYEEADRLIQSIRVSLRSVEESFQRDYINTSFGTNNPGQPTAT